MFVHVAAWFHPGSVQKTPTHLRIKHYVILTHCNYTIPVIYTGVGYCMWNVCEPVVLVFSA